MITVATIAHATEKELIALTYELFLEAIDQALTSEGELRKKAVERGKDVLKVLTQNLNFEVDLAKDLFDLYVYIQNLLINHFNEADKLQESYNLIHTIYEGYKQIHLGEEVSAIKNAQHIYAGMTYGREQLNEITFEDETRGYKA